MSKVLLGTFILSYFHSASQELRETSEDDIDEEKQS